MSSLIIKGPAFTGGKLQQASVRVEDGLIQAISGEHTGSADRVIELAPGQLLVPAGIETLAAMRDWAEEERDTVETVTRAALAAGVTFVCDQCNTVPRINTPELGRRRSDFVAERSFTDFAVAAHPPKAPARLTDYAAAGIWCLQLFSWDLRPWNEPPDTDDSRECFGRFAEAGLSALVFADEHALREDFPEISETYAVKALIRRLHPDLPVRVFVTLPESVEALLAARDRLPNLRIATAIHSLFVSEKRGFERIGIGARHIPPLRSDEAVAGMRRHAEQGNIDIVMSHHAPHRLSDKYSTDPVPGEFTPKAGYSAIDYTYPLLMTQLGVESACRIYAENPARAAGLNKGVIAPGYEADLAIVDEDPGIVHENIHVTGRMTQGIWRIDPTWLFQSKGVVTPFWGDRLNYLVSKTFLRGNLVFDRASREFHRGDVRQLTLG